jgi:hypothetical protein
LKVNDHGYAEPPVAASPKPALGGAHTGTEAGRSDTSASAAGGETTVDHVRVGGVYVPLDQALVWARDYLTGDGTWAYPAYDAYEAFHDPDVITDADLLAPVLLNVNRITLRAYYSLQKVRDRLQRTLQQIPMRERLEADGIDLGRIGELFAVLDSPGAPDVGGTILAKILHRKRPGVHPALRRERPLLLPRRHRGADPVRTGPDLA